jgi:hypothetical protein
MTIPVDVLVTPFPVAGDHIPQYLLPPGRSRALCGSAPPRLGRARLWPSVNRGWHAVWSRAGPPRPWEAAAPASSPGQNGEDVKSYNIGFCQMSDGCTLPQSPKLQGQDMRM